METTLLQNLPGYVGSSENGNGQVERSRFSKTSKENKFTFQEVDLHERQNKDTSAQSPKQYANSEVQTIVKNCEKLNKNVMTDIIEIQLKNRIDNEVQTSKTVPHDSEVSPVDRSVELIGVSKVN